MGYTREKFKVQGETFQIKPSSPRNVKELFEYIDGSDIEVEEDADISAGMEAVGRQYLDILFLIAEPVDDEVTKDDLDHLDIDINMVDSYMMDFMPMQSVTER